MSIGTQHIPTPNYANSPRTVQKRSITQSGADQTQAPKPTFGLHTVSFAGTQAASKPVTPQFGLPPKKIGQRLNYLA
jgi:hypothetical protein